jgi:hypothetical protein
MFLNVGLTLDEELKDRIWEKITVIPVDMCKNAAENFKNRLQQCIVTGDHPLSADTFSKLNF